MDSRKKKKKSTRLPDIPRISGRDLYAPLAPREGGILEIETTDRISLAFEHAWKARFSSLASACVYGPLAGIVHESAHSLPVL